MVSRGLLALAAMLAPMILAQEVSLDGSCGGALGFTCAESEFGECCSKYGYCGSTETYCGNGCNAEFGTCSTGMAVSDDGSCGAEVELTCLDSSFGDCCSAHGFCGEGTTYCGAGCQTGFGECDEGAASISTDGSCGGDSEFTCLGSEFGDCCSAYGFCGATAVHCGPDCQSDFGSCSEVEEPEEPEEPEEEEPEEPEEEEPEEPEEEEPEEPEEEEPTPTDELDIPTAETTLVPDEPVEGGDIVPGRRWAA